MQKLLAKIRKRKYAYRRLFLTDNGSLNPDAETIIKDLKKFCRAQSSTAVVSPIRGTVDPIAMAMAEGRREVYLRIMAHLHIEDRVIFNLNEENDNE
jgi:nucleoside 2-deoxyribosyltransferase